jgi:molybdate transport system regulatory protein
MPNIRSPSIIRPRIVLDGDLMIGPGKIDLLRAVDAHGSISAAARAQGLAYKRAWLLLDSLNQGCPSPVFHSSTGGSGGGGARLTPFGKALIAHYESIESACQEAAADHLKSLRRLLKRA